MNQPVTATARCMPVLIAAAGEHASRLLGSSHGADQKPNTRRLFEAERPNEKAFKLHCFRLNHHIDT